MMKWLPLLILSTLILAPGCGNPDSPNRNPGTAGSEPAQSEPHDHAEGG